MTNPTLDLMMIDTHNPALLGIVDISKYPTGFNIVSPSIEITVGGFNNKVLTFVPSSLNLFDSNDLGVTCDAECTVAIPDGVVKIKYSVYPALTHSVSKTFFRTDILQEKLDSAFMSLDIVECDGELKSSKKRALDEIYYFLQMAIAASNKGSLQLALNLYQKADKQLTKFINNNCCNG